MKNLIKDKQIATLTFQITIVSVTLMAASFLTETQLWYDYFNFKAYAGICEHANCTKGHGNYPEHYHWNYRGWIYFLTGCAYFVLSVIRIVKTHYIFPEEKARLKVKEYSLRGSIVNAIMILEEKSWKRPNEEEHLEKLRDQLFELDKETKNHE